MDSFSMLQVVFTVISVTSRVLGFGIGIDTDADGTPNGDKTGWSAAEPREGGGYAEAGEERSIWLIDGRRVPRVKGWYKHLGVRAVAKMGWEAARAMVVARCVGMAAALARLGVLSAGEYVEAVDVATLTVIAYYGAIFPIGRDACEQIDKAKRRGLAMLGHTGPQAARWLVHTPRPVGLGLAFTWVHAAAALTVEMDRAMQANASAPARVAATARMATTCWTMGWRPTQKEPTPAAYNPRHAIPVLGEEGIAEAVLKCRRQGERRGRGRCGVRHVGGLPGGGNGRGRDGANLGAGGADVRLEAGAAGRRAEAPLLHRRRERGRDDWREAVAREVADDG